MTDRQADSVLLLLFHSTQLTREKPINKPEISPFSHINVTNELNMQNFC